ncbi:MAG TPA: hypothetical protein VMQ73_10180 [Methylomirabilota bacterium]|nr:hypothetical protein [Methylomirabilota bacterium]
MDLYGQPTGPAGYDVIDSPIFACWMPVLTVVGEEIGHPFEGGYKLHLSVDADDAERVAQHVLPVLQGLRMDHKVVFPVTAYVAMNEGEQRGKFITVYPGPGFAGFASLVRAVDGRLIAITARPGPRPLRRLAGNAMPETAVGKSGLLYGIIVESYRD